MIVRSPRAAAVYALIEAALDVVEVADGPVGELAPRLETLKEAAELFEADL